MRLPLPSSPLSPRRSLLLCLPLLLACSGERREAQPDSTVTIAPRPPAAGDPSCPRDGTWQPCGLLDRVSKAGLAFKPAGDTMRVAYLAVPGVRYQVGRSAALVAFFYPDSVALARDLARVDTLSLRPLDGSGASAAPGDSLGPWPSRPVVIRSANLLVAVLGGSPTQVERLGLTITAGPPQP